MKEPEIKTECYGEEPSLSDAEKIKADLYQKVAKISDSNQTESQVKSRLIEHLQDELKRKDEEIEAWQGMYIEAENKAREYEEKYEVPEMDHRINS